MRMGMAQDEGRIASPVVSTVCSKGYRTQCKAVSLIVLRRFRFVSSRKQRRLVSILPPQFVVSPNKPSSFQVAERGSNTET